MSKDTITQKPILIDTAPKNVVRTAVTVATLSDTDHSQTVIVTSNIDQRLTLPTVPDGKVYSSEEEISAKPEL